MRNLVISVLALAVTVASTSNAQACRSTEKQGSCPSVATNGWTTAEAPKDITALADLTLLSIETLSARSNCTMFLNLRTAG